MILPEASSEQQEVMNALVNNNVVIDSVAGSGKTTCNLHIAKKFTESNILLLTYNSRLKIETREKIHLLKLTNIEAHSYHSFCVKYYNNVCFTDSEIVEILMNNTECIRPFNYDIIIIDETQDMSPLLFQLVCKILKDNNNTPKICILGDERQCIFDFNKADQRFITFAENIFTFNTFPWKHLKLSTSFRVTFEMSEFINNCMLHKNIITSHKITNIKPRYILCQTYGLGLKRDGSGFNRAFQEIEYYLNMGYQPSDIFVLAPSVRNEGTPIKALENKLKKQLDIPIFVPFGDDTVIDNDIIANKLVFSTFHQTKGLERKVVLIFGFDNSYFEYYKKDYDRYSCPNELYVATTRSLEHLSLFHDLEQDYLDFLNKDKIKIYCELIPPEYSWKHIPMRQYNTSNDKHSDTTVTQLLHHIPCDVIDKCYEYIKGNCIREKSKHINILHKTKQNGSPGKPTLYEEVSELTGIAIPEYFEYLLTGKMTIFKCIEEEYKANSEMMVDIINIFNNTNSVKYQEFSLEKLEPSIILQLANIWNSFTNKLLFKLYQIKDYNWVSEENLSLCINRLKTLNITTHNTLYFEYKCMYKHIIYNVPIHGRIDCIHNDTIYEFKCVRALKKEHYIQLALYKYLYETQHPDKKDVNNYYLYNILSDELFLLTSTYDDVCDITKILLEYKYKNKVKKPDNLFLLEITNIIKLYQ
jgi:hypothetical protein